MRPAAPLRQVEHRVVPGYFKGRKGCVECKLMNIKGNNCGTEYGCMDCKVPVHNKCRHVHLERMVPPP